MATGGERRRSKSPPPAENMPSTQGPPPSSPSSLPTPSSPSSPSSDPSDPSRPTSPTQPPQISPPSLPSQPPQPPRTNTNTKIRVYLPPRSAIELPMRFESLVPSSPPRPRETHVRLTRTVDERCFTWCTQRSASRVFQREPTCHTFCWRRFLPEQRRLVHAAIQPGHINLSRTLSPEEARDTAAREAEADAFARQRDFLQHLAAQYAPPKLAEIERLERERQREMEQLESEVKQTVERARRAVREQTPEVRLKMRLKMREELRQLQARAEQAEQPLHGYREYGDLMQPFPPPMTDRWSWLRGHYVYYLRGPQRATGEWRNMRYLGMNGMNLEYLLRKQGTPVGAVMSSGMVDRSRAPRTVGLKQLADDEAGEEARQKTVDPNYWAIVSLEHVPPAIYTSLTSRLERIFSPALSLLSRYKESFTSGQQLRSARILWEKVTDEEDGPRGVWRRVGEGLDKVREKRERAVRELEERMKREREGEKDPMTLSESSSTASSERPSSAASSSTSRLATSIVSGPASSASSSPVSPQPPNSDSPSSAPDEVTQLIELVSSVGTVFLPPQLDERCFTLCTQRSNSRVFQSAPACHTLCWRRVSDYERQLIRAVSRPLNVGVKTVGARRRKTERELQERNTRFEAEMARLSDLAARGPPPTAAEEVRRSREDSVNILRTFLDLIPLLADKVRSSRSMDNPSLGAEYRERFDELQQKIQERIKEDESLFATAAWGRRTGRWVYPFAPPETDRWRFLRGHYFYYARGPPEAKRQMESMHHLGFDGVWRTEGAWAVRGGREGKKDEGGVRPVGLGDLQEGRKREAPAETAEDPKHSYALLISLEHVPQQALNSLGHRLQRMYTPLSTLLGQMGDGLASGQQRTMAGKLWERALDLEGGPVGMWRKMGEELNRRRKEEEREREEREGKKGGAV
ncbi:hypothetical protein CALCODRAFT_510301 [Calocera cornea HHB12733]|uniref:Uncharacterized protein n=1 Tax=Calocera cornea HHB12733 TaxID=1353952 RepID=A0A165EMJ3_9BASI|nr:hypothetical protein CALCODRAFT_510301 [Calocera cornea HHB12733]